VGDPLGTYLNDHRAGAAGAIELLEHLVAHHRGTELGTFAEDLLVRVRADRDVLERLVEAVGEPNVLKEAAAWVGEKLSRLKLPKDDEAGLGLFETLEALVLGITGKKALWDALAQIAPDDRRLAGVDFGALARDAQSQVNLVNARRLAMVHDALVGERQAAGEEP
jgi:hypothetical protein